MFICYLSKTNRFKTVPAWYRVIKMLSDMLSELVKLNHGEFSKYHLCPPKIDMAHVYLLFFKVKSIWNGSKVIMVLSDTHSNLDKLNYGKYNKYQLCSSKIDMTHVHKNWHDTCLFLKISVPCKFFMNINGTCHGWAWRGCWGCPRTFWVNCIMLGLF